MNAFFTAVRNFFAISLAIFVGLYITVLLQLAGLLPATELSDNVVAEVVSRMGE